MCLPAFLKGPSRVILPSFLSTCPCLVPSRSCSALVLTRVQNLGHGARPWTQGPGICLARALTSTMDGPHALVNAAGSIIAGRVLGYFNFFPLDIVRPAYTTSYRKCPAIQPTRPRRRTPHPLHLHHPLSNTNVPPPPLHPTKNRGNHPHILQREFEAHLRGDRYKAKYRAERSKT
ncbi:hypothetical protein BDZ89DRAFT_538611 [Hymenopellis radicata]|nr:hypothetical protein BDZ89DRAFT_538611 [Hymenopellis radicata]